MIKRCLLLLLILAVSVQAESIRERYLKKYDFITMEDTIFTFQSEFAIPDGFHLQPESEIREFQAWLRDFPLWHQWKAVGSIRGGKAFEANEIARPVHIPWDGQRYTDRAFMIRILAEFYRYKHREMDFSFEPKMGDAIDYPHWLKGKPIYTPRMELALEDDTARAASDFQFYSFIHFMIDDGNYRSLAANCDTIALDELSIGDMLIEHDRVGKKGKSYIVMSEAVNDKGDKLFILGTGCDTACDFYIPKFDKDRNSPWLTLTEVHKLAKGFNNAGYYRFRNIPL